MDQRGSVVSAKTVKIRCLSCAWKSEFPATACLYTRESLERQPCPKCAAQTLCVTPPEPPKRKGPRSFIVPKRLTAA